MLLVMTPTTASIENYKKLKEDISELKDKIEEIRDEKEKWFSKKESMKKEIHELIFKIKEIKAEKDKKNIDLQELKKQRDKHNAEVRTLINEIKKVNEEKEPAFKKYNIKIDPSKIQEKINQLEKKVEIETNFDKEKKLMEEIKKLKKSYEESAEILKIAQKTNEIDKKLKESRKKADEFHKKIQETTRDTSYDVFLELSKKITELKKEQEDAFQKFIDHKNKYSEANTQLKSKLDEQYVLSLLFNKNQEVRKIDHEEKQKSFFKEKFRAIEEKLRSKKKLTTEDLISIQGSSDENQT